MQFDAKVKTYGEQTNNEQMQDIEIKKGRKRPRWGVYVIERAVPSDTKIVRERERVNETQFI